MMSRVFLQDIIEDLKFEDLPANWNSFDDDISKVPDEYRSYSFDKIENMIESLRNN